MDIETLISKCRKQNREAQKELYSKYSPLFLSICKRYMRHSEDAEDALIQGFHKILTKIDMYSGSGSFEGWMRRIIVNECLMSLRKQNNFKMQVEINNIDIGSAVTVEDRLAYEDLLKVMNKLPTGYRTVFNLYVIEGYKHREIAEILQISINTSKSQLILAKKRMQSLVKKNYKVNVS